MQDKREHDSLESVINKTFNHINDIVDANTVVGTTIKLTNNLFIIPVSKISVGMISGGGCVPKSKKNNLNAGSGTGFNIVPIGFVVLKESNVTFIPVNTIDDASKKIIDGAFKLFEKLTDSDNNQYEKEGVNNENKS